MNLLKGKQFFCFRLKEFKVNKLLIQDCPLTQAIQFMPRFCLGYWQTGSPLGSAAL